MNIGQALSFIFRFGPLLIRFGPVVMKVIRTIEKLLGQAPGAAKKEVAMKALERILEELGVPKHPDLLHAFGGFVDLLVGVLNWRGEFTHTTHQPKTDYPPDIKAKATEVAFANAKPRSKKTEVDQKLEELERKLKQ